MGFFCCCVVRLNSIVEYYNQHQALPKIIDSSQQFALYKQDPSRDLTDRFFDPTGQSIEQSLPDKITFFRQPDDLEFPIYSNLNFDHLNPLVKKYFHLAMPLQDRVSNLVNKYNLDFASTCLVYYRGNDKELETYTPSYQDVVNRALQTRHRNPEIKFVVQTDEIEFWIYFKSKLPDAIMLEETQPIQRQIANPGLILPLDQREDFCASFLCVIYTLAQCRYIITTTGHVAIWLCLFRGSSQGVQQYRNPKPLQDRYIASPDKQCRYQDGDTFWIT